MSSIDLMGNHFLCSTENEVVIFGVEFYKYQQNWGMGKTFIPIEDVKKFLENMLQEDIDANKLDQIDHIEISHILAGKMYLAGLIANEHFRNSTESSNSIIINNVQLLDKRFKVVIKDDSELVFYAATIDKNGQIIEY